MDFRRSIGNLVFIINFVWIYMGFVDWTKVRPVYKVSQIIRGQRASRTV